MNSKILYKYGSFGDYKLKAYDIDTAQIFDKEYWKLSLLNGYLYTSNPSYFNDPYDCSLLFDTNLVSLHKVRVAILEVLNRYCNLHKIDKDRILQSKDIDRAINFVIDKHGLRNKNVKINYQDILNSVSKDLRDLFFVICLSERYDIFLMWSHYAKDHTGYCIEYTIPKTEPFFKMLYQVNYTTNRNSLSTENINEEKIISLALEKAIFWDYEKEWRFVIPNVNITNNIPKDKQVSRYYLEFKNYISAIYLGSKCQKEHINTVFEEYKNTSVKIYQMRLAELEYKLIREPILN